MPVGNDAWVYEDSFVDGDGPVLWEKTGPDLWRARVTFVCPKPRPTWKSSGERVF